MDVKGDFEELFNAGKTVQSITDELTEKYNSIAGDSVEEPLFWYALADTQWNFGVLLPCVREKALYWIDRDNGCQLPDISERAKREKKLKDLRQKLLSPQPSIKRPKKVRGCTCPWQLGDVFAYQLESELAKEKGLYGRYFFNTES